MIMIEQNKTDKQTNKDTHMHKSEQTNKPQNPNSYLREYLFLSCAQYGYHAKFHHLIYSKLR